MSDMSAKGIAMSKRSDRGLALLLGCLLLAPGAAMSHAAFVDADTVQAVRIQGVYETGEPMAGAQVTVFAPGSPAEPWLVGQADADGVFLFVPDEQPGRWSVRLRQAGHGAMAHLDREPDAAAPLVLTTARAVAPSPVQKTVMAACVVWGCIGTALYFRRTRAG